ncbi:MAG: helix-turn-helix domain-containing protein [Lachnospiraceae bacterium]
MRRLLDPYSQRIIKITEILIQKDSWMTAKALAERLEVSERTILYDIESLKQRWGNHLDVQTSMHQGFRIITQSIYAIQQVISDILSDSVAIRWIESIFFHPYSSTDFFSKELFVSPSTLSRLLPKINLRLRQFGIKIHNDRSKYYIHSENEIYVRRFFSFFLIKMHGLYHDTYFRGLDFSIIRSIVRRDILPDNEAAQFEVSASFYDMLYLASLIREDQGFCIPSDYTFPRKLPAYKMRHITSVFKNISQSNSQPIHEYIETMAYGRMDPKERPLVEVAIHQLFATIMSVLNLKPTPQELQRLELMLCSLYVFTKSFPFEMASLFPRDTYFVEGMRKNNDRTYRVFDTAARKFTDTTKLTIPLPLDSLIFFTYMAYPAMIVTPPTKRLLVVSDRGRHHADFIATLLRRYICEESSIHITIKTIGFPSDSLPSLAPYDAVITTMSNLPYHRQQIIINDYPSDSSLFEIFKLVYTLT